MASNAVFFAWNRSIPGREALSAEHFQDFVGYLGDLEKDGTIASWEVVFLDPHGGDLNGFFLLRGEPQKLDALIGSAAWETHMVRATMHLEGCGHVRSASGGAVMERMERWTGLIPD